MKAGYTVIWIVILQYGGVLSHPQCLDFRPPFETSNLEFCPEYSEFGCCTPEDDLAIQKKHYSIISSIENKDGVMGCRKKLREVMCLQCHPYAAHIYDKEATAIQRPFPGLCQSFCEEFYDACKISIPFLTEDENTLISAESKDLFCEHNAAPDPDYCYPDLDSNAELLHNISREGTSVAGCVCLEEFASGLKNPLLLEVPPDGTQRMFIAEQQGTVYIYHPNKTRNPEPFMNLSSIVHVSSRPGDEKGFLSLAFHPEYAINRRLFVYYSINHEGSHKTRLSEFLADPENMDKVDEDSERVILDTDQPYENHNGGALFFGIDSYLYLSLGDGGAAGDPHGNSQDLGSLLGKIIRLDIDSPPVAGAQYTVPLDNPFIEVPEAKPEIFVYGVRNIWRCDVDEGDAETGHGHGRIICGDVGQNAYEEINIIKSRRNYGWNTREGFECYRNSDLCGQLADEELPIYAYPHSDGKSVTGGHVYRGCQNPNFYGNYIYGDFVFGNLWTLEEDLDTKQWKNSKLETCGPDVCFNGLTGLYVQNILSFGEDFDGEIYMLSTSYASSAVDSGKVYKFVDPKRRGDPTSCRSYQAQNVPETTESTENMTDAPTIESTEDMTDAPDNSGNRTGGTTMNGLYVTTCILLPIMKCFNIP